MPPPLLLLTFLVFNVVQLEAVLTAKLFVVDEQPVQPYDDWGVACTNMTAEGCRGGMAAANAIIRHRTNGADLVVKIGALNGMSKFISLHPRFLEVNFDIYGSMSFDTLFLATSSIATMAKLRKGLHNIAMGMLRVVNTNFALDSAYLRSVMDFVYIRKHGDFSIAFLPVFPTKYKSNGAPVNYVLNYISTLRGHFGVTHVVLWITLNWEGVMKDVESYTESDLVDIVVYRSRPLASSPDGNATAPVRVRKTWQIDIFPLYPRVDELNMVLDEHGVVSVQARAHSPEVVPESYRDATYSRDLETLQTLTDESLQADLVVGQTTAPMPYSYRKFSNGTVHAPCRFRECELGTLTTEAMLATARLGGDVAILNGGNQFDGWPAGDVRISHLTKTQPYNDYLCYVNVSAVVLWRALEHSVSTLTSEGHFNPDAEVNEQFLQVQGLKFSFDPSYPPGSRITEMLTEENGEWVPIDTKRPYRVIATSWICSGGDGFELTPLMGRDPIWSHSEDETSITADYLQKTSPYTPHVKGLIVRSVGLPPLKLAKVQEECDEHSQYLPLWEVCDPCPPGTWNPTSVEGGCIARPASTTVNLPMILGIVLGITAVGGFGVYWVLTKKQRRIRQLYNANRIAEDCAEAVASMRLEELDYLLDLERPNRLQGAFIKITSTLKMYREFMPLSVLHDGSDDSEVSKGTPSADHSASVSLLSSDQLGCLHHLHLGLTKKHLSILSANVRNFTSVIKGDLKEIEEVHHRYLYTVLSAAQGGKGVAEPFCGDRVVILWNGPRACASHKEYCMATAQSIQRAVKDLVVEIGVSSGSALAGNIGTDGMKRFCVLGTVYTNALLLMMLNKMYGPGVLITRQLADRLSGKHYVIFEDRLFSRKQRRVIDVWRLVATRCFVEEEWMYQISPTDELGRTPHLLNAAWQRFLVGDTLEAWKNLHILFDERGKVDPTDLPGGSSAIRLRELLDRLVNGMDYAGANPSLLEFF